MDHHPCQIFVHIRESLWKNIPQTTLQVARGSPGTVSTATLSLINLKTVLTPCSLCSLKSVQIIPGIVSVVFPFVPFKRPPKRQGEKTGHGESTVRSIKVLWMQLQEHSQLSSHVEHALNTFSSTRICIEEKTIARILAWRKERQSGPAQGNKTSHVTQIQTKYMPQVGVTQWCG